MTNPPFRFTFFLLVCFILPLVATAQVVDIPDPNLRAAVETALGKASGATITVSDMTRLTHFHASRSNISDLTGLEHAINLIFLELGSNSIIDISPVAGLTNLTQLWLSYNSIIDISPVAGLTNLTQLLLGDNSIIDISPVAGLINLTQLGLSGNSIIDISLLAGLTNLTQLWFSNNPIIDISPVAGLTNLTELLLRGNAISDISLVAELTKLTWLDLGDNLISDLSPVAGLTNLTRLDLWGNDIGDLSPVAGLTNLTWLNLGGNLRNLIRNLSDNLISDISPLAGLTNLTWLHLGYNLISDISPVAGLTKLTYLHLGVNSISDISALAGLTNLTELFLWSNSISDISPVAGLINLTTLELWSNSIRDISPLVVNAGLGSGDTVDVQDNPLSFTSIKTHIPTLQNRGVSVGFTAVTFDETVNSDTSVNIPDPNLRAAVEAALGKTSGATITASDMATLTRLEARSSNISDLTGLEGATNLTWLYLPKNTISDISPVAGLTKLIELDLAVNSISDIAPVAGLTKLTTLELTRNYSISDISPVAGLTNLTDLRLVCGSDIIDILPVAGLTKLTTLDLWGSRIGDLSPVAGLTNLIILSLNGNNIIDISPVAGLTNLRSLGLYGNNISDLSPVAGLTNLIILSLNGNNISDISPLAGLTKLTTLDLRWSSISDLSPLAGLTKLTTLDLWENNISDLSPLVANTGLGSGDFVDVHVNPLSPTSIKTYIPTLQSRGVTVEFYDTTHLNVDELYTVRLIYFLPSDRQPKPDIDTQMDTLIKEVQQAYADDMESYGFGGKTFRFETDATGKAVVHRMAGRFKAKDYQRGTFDKVKGEIEEQFDTYKNIYLVVVDSGYLIDGAAGQATVSDGVSGIAVINNIEHLSNYVYLASHELRHTFGLRHDYHIDSRGFTFKISRCTAELLDVHRYFNPVSQGQNPLSNTTIEMLPLSLASSSSAIRLRFEVTDPDGLHQARLLTPEVELADGRAGGFIACKRLSGVSSGVAFVTTALTPKNKSVSLRIIDVHGNFSRIQSYPIDLTSFHITADINSDGSVNVLDLIFIASDLGNAGANLAADANRDGVVSILDLILVAGMFESAAAAPSAQPQVPEPLTAVEIQGWLTHARSLEVRDPIMKRGFAVLEQLLIALTPKETELLANYPNPFNPETWIPYRLAEDAFVTLTIYDIAGRVVRTLDVGHQIAETYESPSKAIYWDGTNGLGERVASGVYFYHLSAGDYSATQRMVILK